MAASNLTALLLGATGETGKEVLKHLKNEPAFSKIILVGRRVMESEKDNPRVGNQRRYCAVI